MSIFDRPCDGFICAEDLPASGACIDEVDATFIADAIDEASYQLYLMSGRRVYGVCTATVRPEARHCGWGGSCASHCTIEAIRLGEPIQRIKWVMIDGAVLSPTEYRVLDRDKLIRNLGYWPHCQDFTKDLSEEGTWGIRYEYGNEIDWATKRAAIDLTMELIAAAVPGAPRKLSAATTAVSRRGVSLSMKDRNDMMREGASHIESVSAFMALHNPMNQPQTVVYSPDTAPRLHRVSGTFG